MLVALESSSAVLVMICSKSVSIRNRSHAIDEQIVVKERFIRGYPYLMPSFEGNLINQRHQICSQETRALGYHTVKARSLSHLGLNRYRAVTDRQTDGRTDARSHGQNHDS